MVQVLLWQDSTTNYYYYFKNTGTVTRIGTDIHKFKIGLYAENVFSGKLYSFSFLVIYQVYINFLIQYKNRYVLYDYRRKKDRDSTLPDSMENC